LSTGKAPDCAGLRESFPIPRLSSLFARGEITITEIEDATGSQPQHHQGACKEAGGAHYLMQVGKGRGARYTVK